MIVCIMEYHYKDEPMQASKTCTTERFLGNKIDVYYANLLGAGTEAETKEFMSVCVQTAARYPLNDMISPVFIFERLCSIIYPVSTML